MGRWSCSNRRTSPTGTSSTPQIRTSATSEPLLQLALDGGDETLADLGDVHPVQDLLEEPEDDQAFGLLPRDPAAHQVEDLVLGHRADARRVATPGRVV